MSAMPTPPDAAERILAAEERFDDLVALRWERSAALAEEAAELAALQEEIDQDGGEGYWGWKFEELSALEEDGKAVSHVDLALAYLQMGDADGALDHLEEAGRQHDERLVRERNNPAFDELRSEARFRRLMSGLNRRVILRPPGRDGGRPRDGGSGNGRF